jgi:hypothetical protein
VTAMRPSPPAASRRPYLSSPDSASAMLFDSLTARRRARLVSRRLVKGEGVSGPASQKDTGTSCCPSACAAGERPRENLEATNSHWLQPLMRPQASAVGAGFADIHTSSASRGRGNGLVPVSLLSESRVRSTSICGYRCSRPHSCVGKP